MVRTERAFLDELGIERLAAVAGGSLGGMQALEWAVLYPDQVDAIVAIASTHALQPQGVAWNAIARNAITADPGLAGRPLLRHRHARRTAAWASRAWSATSRTCPRSPLGDKFGRRLQFADDIRYTLTEPEFEVESYLRHQADTFVKRFDANTYLYTSRALTYFDLARQYGGGTLERRASRRVGADAAHRVQLRLAVSAVGFGGAGRRRFARLARTSSSTSSTRRTDTTASCWRRRGRRR